VLLRGGHGIRAGQPTGVGVMLSENQLHMYSYELVWGVHNEKCCLISRRPSEPPPPSRTHHGSLYHYSQPPLLHHNLPPGHGTVFRAADDKGGVYSKGWHPTLCTLAARRCTRRAYRITLHWVACSADVLVTRDSHPLVSTMHAPKVGTRTSTEREEFGEHFVAHCFAACNELGCVVVGDRNYPYRIAFDIAALAVEQFLRRYSPARITGDPRDTPYPEIQQLLERYDVPLSCLLPAYPRHPTRHLPMLAAACPPPAKAHSSMCSIHACKRGTTAYAYALLA
jgi:hypothetical protein